MAKIAPPSPPPTGGYVGAQHPSYRRARKPARQMSICRSGGQNVPPSVRGNHKNLHTMQIPRFLILNFFTKSYLRQADRFPLSILNPRFKSMISDLWFSMAIVFPLFLLIMVPYFVFIAIHGDSPNSFKIYISVAMIPWLILLFIILNKDCVNGMSAGKRTFGFKIIDYRTKELASDFQCMIRNITMFVWPLEAIMILINSKRRIGDYIAKTEVEKTDIKPIESLMTELQVKQRLSSKLVYTSIVVSVLLTLIVSLGLI
jgi:uncharacterized RDD family membrane protein YckC